MLALKDCFSLADRHSLRIDDLPEEPRDPGNPLILFMLVIRWRGLDQIGYEGSVRVSGLGEDVPSMRKQLVTCVDPRIVIHL